MNEIVDTNAETAVKHEQTIDIDAYIQKEQKEQIERVIEHINKSSHGSCGILLYDVIRMFRLSGAVSEIRCKLDEKLKPYGLMTIDEVVTKTDEDCIMIGKTTIEIDRIALAKIIDRMTMLYMGSDSNEKGYETYDNVHAEIGSILAQLANLHENWDDFV